MRMSYRNNENKIRKTTILTLVSFIGILFSINMAGSLNPSLFIGIQKTFAEITGRSASNITRILSETSTNLNAKGLKVIDSVAMCDVIDPNLTPVVNKAYELESYTGRKKPTDSKVGVNADMNPQTAGNEGKAVLEEFGMGYTLVSIEGASDSDIAYAKDFINTFGSDTVVPIVRLCARAAVDCKFKLEDSVGGVDPIVYFYRTLASQVAIDFIAMIGPNEPGTGTSSDVDTSAEELEIEAFMGIGNQGYGPLVERIKNVAGDLQSIRAVNGGNIYISPGAANLSNTLRNDVKGLFESIADYSLFDYVMGNLYSKVGGLSAYAQYEDTGGGSLKKIIEANENLQVIFTEFGVIVDGSTGNSREEGVSDAIESMSKFCEDEKVGGVLFFRSIDKPGLVTMDKHRLTDDEVNEIIGNCGTISSRENAWLNCNFDATLNPDYSFSEQSVARSCGANISGASTSPALKVSCDETGCFVTRTVNQRISMPIRAFASNSPTGSLHYNYSPVANDVASLYNGNSSIDPLNQFAGEIKLKNTNISYPMPWLGSALNNAGELLKGSPQGNLTSRNIEQNINPLSLMDESLKEYYSEIESGDFVNGKPSLPVNPTADGEKLNNERALCLSIEGEIIGCIDKSVAANAANLYAPYVPFDREISYKKALGGQCASTNTVYRDEEFNYVTGPEIALKSDQKSRIISELDGSKICTNYARRKTKTRITISGLSFPKINSDIGKEAGCWIETDDLSAFADLNQNGIKNSFEPFCRNITPAQLCGKNGESVSAISELINKGKCEVPDNFSSCMRWDGNGAFFEGATYDENVELDNSLEIPGVYDALANQYIRTQQMLSNRGLKLVVYEDIGWNVKNEIVIRDAGRDTPEQLLTDNPNKMLNSTNQTISGRIPEGVTLFDNSKLLARSSAIGASEIYFNWLGYLDVFQELNTAYVNNGLASKETLIDNPYLNEENYSREQIPPKLANSEFYLKTGDASLVTSFPIYTCDHLESLKYDQTIPEEQRFRIGTYQTCIAARNDIKYDDQDRLSAFLCSRGYDLGEYCKNYCGVNNENSSYDQKPNEPIVRKTGDIEGVYTTLNLNLFDIVATEPPGPAKSAVPIGQFAENNNLSVAINTNFYDTTNNGIIGFFGDNENILYNKPPNLLDYALVKFKSSVVNSSRLDMGNGNIEVSNGTLGIVNIINDFTPEKQGFIKQNAEWVVTGFAYFGLENLPQAGVLNGSTYSSLTDAPRTVIGWNVKNELVIAVFENLNINNLGSASSSSGITHGIILDGGGSAQLYSKAGLGEVEGINQSFVKVDGSVYHPNRGDTAASPRIVPAYLGAVGKVTNRQVINTGNNSSSSTGNLNSVTTSGFSCPLKVGRHACFQGPYGEYSHCGNTETLPLDLFPFTKNSLEDKKVVAPEDSTIIGFRDDSQATSVVFEGRVMNQGQVAVLQGNKTKIIYYLHHFAYDSKFRSLRVGQSLKAGEVMGHLCNNGTNDQNENLNPTKESGSCYYSIGNTHLHITAEIAGIPINPYQMFGDILGCNAEAPPVSSKQGDTEINGNVVASPYCNSNNGDAANILNDNGFCKADKPNPLSKNLLRQLVLGCESEACTNLQENARKDIEDLQNYTEIENGSEDGINRDDLVCRNIDAEIDQSDDPIDPNLQCNEFNCFARPTDTFNPARFKDSVACAANTLSNDIASGKNLAKILDEYGPFCDNETRGSKSDGSTTMAFAYNLLYNFYAKYKNLGSACDAKNSIRQQDIGLTCSDYEQDRTKYDESYNYYRSGLNACIAQNQLGWTSQNSSFGSFSGVNKELGADQNALRNGSLSDFAQALQDGNVNIYGYSLKNTPKAKIVEVLLESYVKNVNPWLLLGVWATESNFGQYKSECNFY